MYSKRSLCFHRYSEKLAARYFYKETKVRITKSEISMRTWRSPMSAASQGAFVMIPEISHSDISMHNQNSRFPAAVFHTYEMA